jgi:hypothetical protein
MRYFQSFGQKFDRQGTIAGRGREEPEDFCEIHHNENLYCVNNR